MNRNTIHGIDLNAPGGLEALFAYNRARFGAATMSVAPGEAPAGTPAPVPAPPATPPATPPAAPAPAKTPAPVEWDGKIESLPGPVQKIIADLRQADGDERVAKKTLDSLLKVLNPDAPTGEKPDADALTRQLTEQTTSARRAQVELALYKASDKHGADTDLITAVLAHKGKLAELDPSANDFATKLDALVKTEVEANPKLRAARAAGQSGADFTGGTGETRNTNVGTGISRLTAAFNK